MADLVRGAGNDERPIDGIPGNRSHHDPQRFRTYQRDPELRDPPRILVRIQDRINDLARRPGACPQIFFHHPGDPDRRRQERSEGRERDAAYLCSMVDHMDMVSMRVGVPKPNGDFHRYSVEDLMAGTELGDDGRFHRSAMRLNETGYVTVKHRSAKNGRGPDNLHASRVVSRKLLHAIGMDREFMCERQLESERRQNGGLTRQETAAALRDATPPAKPPRPKQPAGFPESLAKFLGRAIPTKPP